MGVISPIETLFLKSQHRLLQPRDYSYPVVSHKTQRVANFPHRSFSFLSLGSSSVDFPLRSDLILQNGRLSFPWRRYVSESESAEVYNEKVSIMEVLKKANSFIPHVILSSTILALLYPPSFTWFKPRYFVPGLGFMMFAVGINSNERDFLEALKRPDAIFAGYIGQYLIKPLLGYMFGLIAVSLFKLPTPIATAALVTPMLSLLLIGKKLPVDVVGMVSSILQVVVTPIAAGLLLNRLFPRLSNAIKPFLPALTLIDMACCIGAPPRFEHRLNLVSVRKAPDVKALQRTLSYETGMQSSLLALALATKFFQDPLVGVPPAISTVVMSLMGVSLVTIWKNRKE
ncbi:hypothetical protein F2Q70_00003527 [Brassica cretica]|uniref:Uncharacterized protein n=1 Tax=Brassica cretica TaxID=69181 RepID=A0A8S9J1G0_BRACR|nr:hypothetical protein F2Q70_00003527 [Brassica cretica]